MIGRETGLIARARSLLRGVSLILHETGPLALALRLWLVLGLVLLGATVAAFVWQRSVSTGPSARQTTLPAPRPAVAAPKKTEMPKLAAVDPKLTAVDPDLAAARKMMIAAPPATDPQLQSADPRRLRASFQRGIAALEQKTDDDVASKGARLVNIAAILGYEPARKVIARDYPRSKVIRSEVSSSEAVRYSLDPLLFQEPPSESNQAFLVLLASYFSGRYELDAYANDLLAAVAEDRRLQSENVLKTLRAQLARVPGACTAIAHVVVRARMVTGTECSSQLQQQIEFFIRMTPPAGHEAESRRQALQLLDNPDGDHSAPQ